MKSAAAAALLLLAACGSEPGQRPPAKEPPAPPFALSASEGDPLPQSSAPPKSVPAPDPLLAPGDLLQVSVFRQPDLALEVRIPQDGSITYPLIGPVAAAERTTAQLEQTIRQKLEKDYLNEPSVTVTVKEYAKRKVYVVGGVTKPGGYEISPASRITVLQLVAAAEGFSERAYKEYVQIVRRRGQNGREVISLDLVQVERLIAKGHAEADLELWPDDLLVIPSAVRVAYVLGAVNKPGNVEVPNGARMTVSMAVSHAGSYTKFAATGRVQVLRHMPSGETRKITVDLDAVLNGRLELDLDLQPGDVVWVPERGLF
jgi:polysaccharide export outer membrane protein